MIETSVIMKGLLAENVKMGQVYQRNVLKEYLQILVLSFIYSNPEYSKLVFYGGSALRHCYDLPRLSEDLDFVDTQKKIDLGSLRGDLESYFEKETDLKPVATVQKFRVHIKFPILKKLGIATESDSDYLILKIEVFQEFGFCRKFKTETIPMFKFNLPILVNTFDLPTLMATKIRAIFYRKWEKTNKAGETLATVKGRDYFDLMWYLEKGIKPNIGCLEDVKNMAELMAKLLGAIKKANPKSIELDLAALIPDQNYVKNISQNLRDILARQIKQ